MARIEAVKNRKRQEAAGAVRWAPGDPAVYVLLVAACLLVFGSVHHYDFFQVDDAIYILQNEQVQSGLNLSSLWYALSSTDLRIWHPLTYFSHMLDCQLFGLNPAGHHLHSLLLHLVNTGLLFLLLRRLGAARWPAAMVCLLFAVHPYHVEPVASISSRKDLLCALFWTLGALAYLKSVERPTLGRQAAVAVFFLLALLSKATAVTFPLFLLVLDFWPLGRLRLESFPDWRRRVLEKWPLFALALGGAAVTYAVSMSQQAIFRQLEMPLANRIASAIVVYATYLWKTLLPHGFSFLYTDNGEMPALWKLGLSMVVLCTITIVCLMQARKRPYLLAGWAWYVVILLPSCGIVRNAVQVEADRYTYLPLTGIFIMIVWTAAELIRKAKVARAVVGVITAALILTLAVLARIQAELWRTPEPFYLHALALDDENAIAHINYGIMLLQEGDVPKAIAQLEKAREVSVVPDPFVYFHLADAYAQAERPQDAIRLRLGASELWPEIAENHLVLAALYRQLGSLEAAEASALTALHLAPEQAQIYMMLGMIQADRKKASEARATFEKAVRLDPASPVVGMAFAAFLEQQGDLEGAGKQLRKILEQDPTFAPAAEGLKRVLGSQTKSG